MSMNKTEQAELEGLKRKLSRLEKQHECLRETNARLTREIELYAEEFGLSDDERDAIAFKARAGAQ